MSESWLFYAAMALKAAMALWSIGFFWILALGTYDAFFGVDEELTAPENRDERKVYLLLVMFIAAYWPVLLAAMACDEIREKAKRRNGKP